MTKQDIIDHLTHNCGLRGASVIAAVNGAIEVITSALINGDKVYLRGFGTYEVQDVKEKMGRDISKGTPIVIPAHKTVRFRLSKDFKNRLNGQ